MVQPLPTNQYCIGKKFLINVSFCQGSCTLSLAHRLHAEDSDIDLIPHLGKKTGSHMDVVFSGEEPISKFSTIWITCTLSPAHGLLAEDYDIDLIPHLGIKTGSHMDVAFSGEEPISKLSTIWITCSTEYKGEGGARRREL